MSLFVLADLHLCLGDPSKTMSIFSGWQDYQERIKKHWLELIKNEDTVVLPGDISWDYGHLLYYPIKHHWQ